MRTILRVPAADMATEMAVGAQMAMLGRNASDESSLSMRALAIITPYLSDGGGTERGEEPTSCRRGFVYLSWDWDRGRGEFRVVKWDGTRWR